LESAHPLPLFSQEKVEETDFTAMTPEQLGLPSSLRPSRTSNPSPFYRNLRHIAHLSPPNHPTAVAALQASAKMQRDMAAQRKALTNEVSDAKGEKHANPR